MIDPTQSKEILKQTVANSGISGKLYIDANREECFLRLKVVDLVNFEPAQLADILCSALTMVGEGLNLEVKRHIK